eukprot:g6920.t1
MNRVSSFFLKHHWEIFKVVFPTSIGCGFVYTWNYGSSPLSDFKNYISGSSSNADVLTIRFGSSIGSSR